MNPVAENGLLDTIWPDLEEFRLDDVLLEHVYETTPAQFRAALKTGIALEHAFFANVGERVERLRHLPHAGFMYYQAARPVSWTALVFSSAYKAAARLCAASILPNICGVPFILPLCVSSPAPESVISLELSGASDIYSGTCEDIAGIIVKLRRLSGFRRGRAIVLHRGELADLCEQIKKIRVPVYEECGPPALRLLSPQCFSADILNFCHGFKPEAAPEYDRLDDDFIDAVFADNALCDKLSRKSGEAMRAAPLIIAPGCEGFWLFPGLGPDFFQERVNMAQLT